MTTEITNKNGGSAWESNPPGSLETPLFIGFSVVMILKIG